jgi:hypothetical protein
MPRTFFISYRRDDTSGHAGRLYDRLRKQFGEHRVFMDVAIRSGDRFAMSIDQAITPSTVALVVVGREWLTAADAEGRRRLDDPGDFVRLEVATALARAARVVPILVQGAPMPAPSDLPSGLEGLSERQAVEIRDNRFDADVEHLVRSLRDWWYLPKGAAAGLLAAAAVVAVLATPLRDVVARSLFPPRPHDLRIRLSATDGTAVAYGTVTVDFGTRKLSAPVGANGLAYLPEIPDVSEALFAVADVPGYELRDKTPQRLPDAEGKVIEIRLQPVPVEATGEVIDAKGQPVAGAVVEVADGGASGRTDAAGRFSFTVPVRPGQLVEVTVRQEGWVGYRDTLTFPGPHKLLFRRK